MRRLLPYWQEVDAAHAEQIGQFLYRQQGKASRLVGHRHYRLADYTVHHRRAGTFFLKTISDRTLPTESINFENLKGGPYLNSGDCYAINDGQEYYDLFPVMNWRRLPGVTASTRKGTQVRHSFAGGVSDGASGATAMTYIRQGEEGHNVDARKSWFFHGDAMVCLMGGWKAPTDSTVATSIEQCRFRGLASVGSNGKSPTQHSKGHAKIAAKQWLLHNGIGYIPLGEVGLDVSIKPQQGRWSEINDRYSVDENPLVEEEVLSVLMRHGSKPRETGYAVLLGTDPVQLDAVAAAAPWDVLCNNRNCQAIRFHDGPTIMAFFQPGEFHGVQVDRPCLLMLSSQEVNVCDPTHQGSSLALSIDGTKQEVMLPPGGQILTVERP